MLLAVVVAAAMVVGGWSSERGTAEAMATAEDFALSLLEMGSSSESGAGGAPQSPFSPAGMTWGGDESGEWRYKWGRIFKKGGKEERVVTVEYTGLEKPNAKVILSEKRDTFGRDSCRKSLDIEWPVWFCLSEAHKGRTFIYLIARKIGGWDDDENRGGLVAETPYTGFVAWSKMQVHNSNYTEGVFDDASLVTLDLTDQSLVVEYRDNRDEARVFLQHPRVMQGEKCMAHAGPLPPVWLCVGQPASMLKVYSRSADGGRGSLVAEAS